MKVYTTYIQSPIGWIELRATETHLTMARWVPEPAVEREESINPILQETIWQLEEYFEGKRTSFELPILQEGTPFQQRVWEELQLIPYGKQISYQELAK
ncbi:methylated-DNA--[protein]-cysteine S-methyltransferase, partial [Macellibacteroides fermentans]|uniref:methylated-DNA--[protein]-cysteine S-methyltransferase n=1 Tax=Macellibacteroides fermentans TaxID=879969 RepID=UPI00406CFCAD